MGTESAAGGSVLFYDAGCGVCAWVALRALHAAAPRMLRVAPIDSPEGDAHLGLMSDTERWASWHLLGEDGRVRSGGAALPALLELVPRLRPLAPLPRAMPRAADGLYRTLARTRPRWGQLVPRRAITRARLELDVNTNPRRQGMAECRIH